MVLYARAGARRPVRDGAFTMSARATWKGFLKISLVTIPIRVSPATEASESISFNQLHTSCQPHARVHQKRWCASCTREVPVAEIVKGFEFEPGKYVLFTEAELDAVKPPSARVIDLVQFAPASALELRTIDRAYFLEADGPEGGSAEDGLRTFAAAMRGQVGIGKVAIYGREYLVAVGPRDGRLLLYTLHHAAELRTAAALASDRALPGVAVARQILAALTRPLDLADFQDDYQIGLQRLIDAKIAGDEIVVPTVIDAPPVVNLRDALTQSLLAVTAKKKKPASIKIDTKAPPKRKRAS